MTRIWHISDTHTFHTSLKIPNVDLIIHSGDFSNQRNPYLNENELRKGLDWFSSLPIQHKICTMGNHDSSFEKGLIKKEDYPNITILIHEQAEIEGLKIFGSPYTPRFGEWSYMYKRNVGQNIWKEIPDDTQILITHGMPKSILDLTIDENNNLIQVGCKSLLNKIKTLKNLKIFCGGHLHSENGINNFGIYENWGIKFVNSSCLNHKTNEFYQGNIIEI